MLTSHKFRLSAGLPPLGVPAKGGAARRRRDSGTAAERCPEPEPHWLTKRQQPPTCTPRGLVTLGNTCNLDAAAQFLAHCAPFSAALTADASSLAASDKDATLSRAVAQLCFALHERGLKSAIRPADLINERPRSPGFGSRRHWLPLKGLHLHLDALSPADAEAECKVMNECQPPTRRPEFRPLPLGPRAHSRAH